MLDDVKRELDKDNFYRYFDKVIAEKSGEKEEDNTLSLGVPNAVARRRAQSREEHAGNDDIEHIENSTNELGERDSEPAEKPVEHLEESGNAQRLDDLVAFGPDGSKQNEQLSAVGLKQFDNNIENISGGKILDKSNGIEQKEKGVGIQARDNEERAKQAVGGTAIEAPASKYKKKVVITPPVIAENKLSGVAKEQLDAGQKQVPKERLTEPAESAKPVVTIDKIEPAPYDQEIKIQADPGMERELNNQKNPTSKGTLTENPPITKPKLQEIKSVDQIKEEGDKEVPIKVNGAIQPSGEYFEDPNQRITSRGGMDRIKEIQGRINGDSNAEYVKPSRPDELDSAVKQEREAAIIKDGRDLYQVEINQASNKDKIGEQPEVKVDNVIAGKSDVDRGDEGIHRLVMKRPPEIDPFQEAREIGRQPDVTAKELSSLMPGGSSQTAESELEKEQLLKAA